jgi:hypothetical protein
MKTTHNLLNIPLQESTVRCFTLQQTRIEMKFFRQFLNHKPLFTAELEENFKHELTIGFAGNLTIMHGKNFISQRM